MINLISTFGSVSLTKNFLFAAPAFVTDTLIFINSSSRRRCLIKEVSLKVLKIHKKTLEKFLPTPFFTENLRWLLLYQLDLLDFFEKEE